MKNSFASFTLLMLGFILLFVGCKKYTEGPSFSLRTRKARITNEWKVSKIVYDKSDSSNWSFKSCTFSIQSDNTMSKETVSDVNTTITNGTWKFTDVHSVLEFDENEIIRNGVSVYAKAQHDFIILKLTKKEIAFEEKIAGHSTIYYCTEK
jgi:hypothetical protein